MGTCTSAPRQYEPESDPVLSQSRQLSHEPPKEESKQLNRSNTVQHESTLGATGTIVHVSVAPAVASPSYSSFSHSKGSVSLPHSRASSSLHQKHTINERECPVAFRDFITTTTTDTSAVSHNLEHGVTKREELALASKQRPPPVAGDALQVKALRSSQLSSLKRDGASHDVLSIFEHSPTVPWRPCCYSQHSSPCCCQRLAFECKRNSEFPVAPPIMWMVLFITPSLSYHSLNNKMPARENYRRVAFQRFAQLLSFYCCYHPDFEITKSAASRLWNEERQRRRAALYFAEQLVLESYALLLAQSSDQTPLEAALPVLPSDVDLGDATPWLSTEQGGIDGASMAPLRCRGVLGVNPSNPAAAPPKKQELHVVYDLEPLCGGLLWKRMLVSGRGWRRPSSRSVVSLRYAFISTPWEECAVQSVLEAVECWSTITVWLLPSVLRSSVILPNQQEDESELRRTINVALSHLGRSSETCPNSLLPLLPQTIVHCFCIAAKTMTQGEMCALTSPWFELLRPPGEASVGGACVLLLKLDSWAFVTPLYDQEPVRRSSTLVLHTYRRTITAAAPLASESTLTNSPAPFSKLVVDEKPRCGSRITVDVTLRAALPSLSDVFGDHASMTATLKKRIDFVVGSGCVPALFEEALTYFTTGSSGCVWTQTSAVQNASFLNLWRHVDGSLTLNLGPSESPLSVHLVLVRITSSTWQTRYNNDLVANALSSPAVPAPLARYVAATKSLADLDAEFHDAAVDALQASASSPSTINNPNNKMDLNSVPALQNAATRLAAQLDTAELPTDLLGLWPSMLYAPTTDLALRNVLRNAQGLAVWTVAPDYHALWYQTLHFSTLVQPDFLVSSSCPPFLAIADPFFLCAGLVPADSAAGLQQFSCTDIAFFIAQQQNEICHPDWASVLQLISSRTDANLDVMRKSLSYVGGGVIRRFFDATLMLPAQQILLLSNAYRPSVTYLNLPQTRELWPTATNLSEHTSPQNALGDTLRLVLNATTSSADRSQYNVDTAATGICWVPKEYRTFVLSPIDHSRWSAAHAAEALHSALESVLADALHLAKDQDTQSTFTRCTDLKTPNNPRDDVSISVADSVSYNIVADVEGSLSFLPRNHNKHYGNASRWVVPCEVFVEGLRHYLAPFSEAEQPSVSLESCASRFLNRWPAVAFFPGVVTAFPPFFHAVCLDLQHHTGTQLRVSKHNGLMQMVCDVNLSQKALKQYACAPFAAVALLRETLHVVQLLFSRAHVSLPNELLQRVVIYIAQQQGSQHQNCSPPFASVLALLALGLSLLQHPPSTVSPLENLERVLFWTSQLSTEDVVRYLLWHTHSLFDTRSNTLDHTAAFQLNLVRGSLLHSLLHWPTPFWTLDDAMPHVRYSVDPFLHVLWTAGCCTAPLHKALVSWISNTRSARTFYFLPKEAASVRWALCTESMGTHRFVPLAPTAQMCSLLVIMVFRTIVAFDPWSGYALNGFPFYRKQQPCMECTECTLRPSNSVLANWLDLCSWIIPLISALRRALGLDDSTQAPALVDVLPTIRAMLLVADALFRLHAFADTSGFEAALRQSLVMSYGAPPLVLFCCFGLITSAYLKGEGQEETRQTRLCARLFRFYRALYSQTPFHIGLPNPCPPQLSVTSGSSSPAVGYRAYSMAHTSQSVAPPLPHLVHDICPARLAMYALRLTSEVAQNLPAGRSKEFDAETISLPALPLWQRAETLLWNITAQLAPDLFLWFEAFLVRPLLAQLSTSTLRPTKRRCNKNGCCFPNDKDSALLSYLPVESNTFDDGNDFEKRDEEDWVSAAVLTLGNNAIAGALGVGTPRYMKHDPSLYDIAPEFQNENARLIAQGVDVWCAGNPVLPVLVNQDDPIIGVAAGEHHTVLLTSKRVLAWGCNSYQQCGPVFQKPTMRWSTGALAECFRPGVSCDAAVEALTRYVAAWLEGSAVEVNGSLNLDVPEYSAREESKGSRAILSSTHRSTADYYNANHRLDTAVLTPQEVFFENNIDSPVIQVLAGATFSLARTQQGRLWLWGNLQDGCLGRYHNARPEALDGDETGRFILASLVATRSTSNGFQRKLRAYLHARLHCIRFCACGMLHVAAIDSYGGLWVWGQSEAGQLGFVPPFPLLPSAYSSELSKLHPRAVFYPHRLRLFLCKLTGGNDTLPTDAFFETSLTRFTTLISFLWSKARQQLHQLLASLQLEVPQSDLAQHISCRLSLKYSVLLVAVTDHVLLNWSRLDLDSIFGSRPLCPTELQFDLVSCGEGHTLAAGHLPASPSPWLLAWGQGKYGQLGLGDSTRNTQPVVDIEALLVDTNSEPAFITELDAKVVPCIVSWRKSLHSTSSPSIKLLRSGGCANALVSNDGQLLLWGSNDFGVLGFKERTTQEVRSPRLYSEFPDDFGAVKDVVFAMGGTRTFVVSATGRVLCFGQDQDGASGSRIGKTGAVRVLSDHRRWHPPHTTPVLFPPKLRVSALAAGAAHTVFIPLNSSPSNMNHLRLSYLNQSVQNHAASAVVELPSAGRTAITNAQVKIGSSPIRPEYVTCSDLSPGTDALQLQASEKQSTVDSSVSTPLARRSTYHSHSAIQRSHQTTSPFAQRLSSFGQTLLNGVSVTVKALGQALQDQQEVENNANFNYRKPQRSRSYVHRRNPSYSRHASMPLPLMQRRHQSPARPQPPLPFAQRDTPEPSISRSISWQHSSVVPYPYSPAATAYRSPQTASHRPAPFTLSSRYTTPRDTSVRRAVPAPPTPDRRATLSSTRYRQSAPLSSQYLLWVSDPPALSRYPLPTPVSPIRPLLPCSSSAPWPPSSCHLRHP